MSADVTPLATGTTPGFGLPYPDDSEVAAGSDQMQALATATDNAIGTRAHWADGVPRFADAAARDAAYLPIGGAKVGMTCYLVDLAQVLAYDAVGWYPIGGRMPSARVEWGGGPTAAGMSIWAHAPSIVNFQGGITVSAAGSLTLPYGGEYHIGSVLEGGLSGQPFYLQTAIAVDGVPEGYDKYFSDGGYHPIASMYIHRGLAVGTVVTGAGFCGAAWTLDRCILSVTYAGRT